MLACTQRWRGQLAVVRQASQLGAGARAARRAVVGLARTHHEIAAVGLLVVGEQLDVIDQCAVLAAYACASRAPSIFHVRSVSRSIAQPQVLAMPGHQEEPVAAPATSPVNRPYPGTSTATCWRWRYEATLAMVTAPSSCSVALTCPTGVSIRCSPGAILPRCRNDATRPIVPWPHMPR